MPGLQEVKEGKIGINPDLILPMILTHENNIRLYKALLVETGIIEAPPSTDQDDILYSTPYMMSRHRKV